MAAIAPGALVTCRQTGAILYVVAARADNERSWRLRAERVDHLGRSDVSALTVGDGDITVIREAETYEAATMIEHTRRSYRSDHAFASLRSPNRKI